MDCRAKGGGPHEVLLEVPGITQERFAASIRPALSLLAVVTAWSWGTGTPNLRVSLRADADWDTAAAQVVTAIRAIVV